MSKAISGDLRHPHVAAAHAGYSLNRSPDQQSDIRDLRHPACRWRSCGLHALPSCPGFSRLVPGHPRPSFPATPGTWKASSRTIGVSKRAASAGCKDLDPRLHIHNSGYMESEHAVLGLAALAQSTRLDVFRLLVRHEPAGLAAGDIARSLAIPQNTMSAHLGVLSRARLVSSQRFSRSIVYRADLDQLQRLMLFMIRDCCDGRPEICAPLVENLTPCCSPAKKKRAHARI
jgi:ArsR family transcriptional regulator, arsenate/arsenite/antimonite-responsive transcriptional repressor